MKTFLIGGTGFLGTTLVPLLQKNHYQVCTLTRNSERAASLEAGGGDPGARFRTSGDKRALGAGADSDSIRVMKSGIRFRFENLRFYI